MMALQFWLKILFNVWRWPQIPISSLCHNQQVNTRDRHTQWTQ